MDQQVFSNGPTGILQFQERLHQIHDSTLLRGYEDHYTKYTKLTTTTLSYASQLLIWRSRVLQKEHTPLHGKICGLKLRLKETLNNLYLNWKWRMRLCISKYPWAWNLMTKISILFSPRSPNDWGIDEQIVNEIAEAVSYGNSAGGWTKVRNGLGFLFMWDKRSVNKVGGSSELF